ncbi:MAG: D-amino acid aminotransferase [Gammaproteobacteria bacterium]|nr:D-amino acid aminotransferase [Gammaproteobacteria bacterium]
MKPCSISNRPAAHVTIAYLNGTFLPLEEARVSVMDRGFLFGDGVYEVIPVYGGQLFRLAHHLRRLQNSLDAVRIGNPLRDEEWKNILTRLITQNSDSDQAVYLQVTRGVAKRRDHAFPEDTPPTVFAMSTPCPSSAGIDTVTGIRAVTLEDNRWKHCNIKAITLLPNVLLRQEAIDAGTAEAILIKDGFAIEGAASNIFIVTNNIVITPPNGPALLPGITRDLVLELAANNSIPYREADIPVDDLLSADEIWLSSSTREISPVIRLDDITVGAGVPGPLWKRMITLYQDYKEAVRKGKVK